MCVFFDFPFLFFGSFHALLFNAPVVDLTAQAATEQRKLVSEASDSLAQFWTDPKVAAGKEAALTLV